MSRLTTVSEDIILKAISGDTEAFTLIYKSYYQKVYFIGIQYFRNEETAKDIVQEVFIKVHKQIHTLNSPKAFNSWLHVLAYRVCISYDRKKIRFIQLDEGKFVEDFVDDKAVGISDQVENNRIQQIVVNTLDSMSLPLKEVGQLRFLNELKIEEIADVLDIPRNTVGSRLRAVRKNLKTELERNGISIDKNLSLLLVSPGFLYEAYRMLNDKYLMSEVAAENVLQRVLGNTAAVTTGVSMLQKIFIGAVAISVLVGGTLLLNQGDSVKDAKETERIAQPSVAPVESEEMELAKIVNVTYDAAWRNTALIIQVETTNDNYDKITINHEETLQIINNGTYTIRLIKDNEVLEERLITISNIDRYSPLATTEEAGDYYYLYLNDNDSGIDEQSIQYYKNGVLSNDYTYDANNKMIVINNDIFSIHELYVNDLATNQLYIELALKE